MVLPLIVPLFSEYIHQSQTYHERVKIGMFLELFKD